MDHRDTHRVVDGNLLHVEPVKSVFVPLLSQIGRQHSCQIITHQDSEFYPGLWREFTQFVADRGRMTLIDIIINARPDPGSDGLVHADTHLTMAKCVPQNVFVGLSPIFGPCSSSVEISLSIFANIDHAVPLPYSPSPPVLQPSSITSLKAHSTILTSSTMVNVFNDIFATITNAPILGEVVAFPRCPMRITDYQMRYALN
ncbi:hypothetical protein BLNAU_23917 [Blattamonas nauphoetae]|uniref:Uncharacterized protein n=1 Tax=Blattamonas nauphoetae TaxID=2049346 RepID=A0ABQ9WNU6_9EUKA|nr:hypothetical protein BLNAU_23917 [Blattamonas nauphoetae]